MTNIAVDENLLKSIHSVFLESHETDEEGALVEVSLMIAISKRDKYLSECKRFEDKYKMTFDALETKARAEKGKEDFEIEDDLNDWEFALTSLKWWDSKVVELNRVS